ncbi:peroxide stress protein YaaA [Amycolatopsis aidingensis]|uniref:peroxide stress protein YaaA n=1 Tax=Amycolatopsis aidingensis TaxID=2842453 RepID=UPI001C0E8D8D|nr:peroxide stress protein YaaA [Amycolatopsis aidingensis]
MLVLLPPSETKAPGGDGPPLDLDALSFSALNPVRAKLADALVDLATDVPASLRALKLSERQRDEVTRNAELWSAPTLPALRRYTGVLYDALDVPGLRRAELAKAGRRLAVASALFGVLRGTDRIPAYRLSGGSALPAVGPLGGFWRPVLEPVLAAEPGLVVDLRSGPYAALARVPGAVTVRVVSTDAQGRRTTVSHHNKAYKGRLARVLATLPREPSTVDSLVRAVAKAGLPIDRVGEHELELTADPDSQVNRRVCRSRNRVCSPWPTRLPRRPTR